MPGLSFENRTVNLLGFREAAALVQRGGSRECQCQFIRVSQDVTETQLLCPSPTLMAHRS